MNKGLRIKERRIFEIMLVVLVLGMAALMHRMGVHKGVVLNLYYLPIVLSGYHLGRHSAGILAFFSTLGVAIVCSLDGACLGVYNTPAMTVLALSVWAATLGLAAILVGTLCDERKATLAELHEAYVGVIEVIAQYLKGADDRVKTLTVRAAQLSQSVAAEMGLDAQEGDDIRVGVLLGDLGDVEVTTKLLNRAVNAMEAEPSQASKYTFMGTDLVDSLGGVLTRAASLMLNQDDTIRECLAGGGESAPPDIPVGAKIIRAVRQYVTLTMDVAGGTKMSSADAIREMREDTLGGYDPHVVAAIERVVQRPTTAHPRAGQRPEPALQAR